MKYGLALFQNEKDLPVSLRVSGSILAKTCPPPRNQISRTADVRPILIFSSKSANRTLFKIKSTADAHAPAGH